MTGEIHPAALPLDELLRVCEVRRTRRSGPGGQHRNKVETAIVLTHTPSGIAAEASERRSQAENQQMALFRLRLKLALALRAPIGADTSPSALWVARVRKGRLAINPQHADLPALLAEALDHLAAENFATAAAAARLGVSSSQLVGLLRREPAALAQLNIERARRGWRPLK